MATPRICSIPDCGKPTIARGWCPSHYLRWRRHGDPLRGGTTWNEPERFYREVVIPYEGDECIVWPYGRTEQGYARITYNHKTVKAHRRVCEEVYGPPPTPKHEAAHSCGNGAGGCVTKRHLRWATRKENMDDRILHGTSHRGSDHYNVKLTEDDVKSIRSLRDALPQSVIAKQFGVSQTLVSSIQRRKHWAWLG